jgi:hypothetical protein
MSSDLSSKVGTGFKVTKVKWSGTNVDYSMLFFSDRVIFYKVGGQTSGDIAAVALGGAVGGALGGLIGSAISSKMGKGKEQEERIKKFNELTPEELVKSDKSNFEILYSDIQKVEIKKSVMGVNGLRTGTVSISGAKNEKVDICAGQNFDACVGIVRSFLAGKVGI